MESEKGHGLSTEGKRMKRLRIENPGREMIKANSRDSKCVVWEVNL